MFHFPLDGDLSDGGSELLDEEIVEGGKEEAPDLARGMAHPTTGGKCKARRSSGGASPESKRHSPDPIGSALSQFNTDAEKLDWAVARIHELAETNKQLSIDQAHNAQQIAILQTERPEVKAAPPPKADTKGMVELKRSVADFEKRLSIAIQSNMRSATTPSPAIVERQAAVYDWNSIEAMTNRPSGAQVVALIGALHRMTASLSNREAVSSIMCLSEGDRAAFVDGRRTVCLHDQAVPPSVLWQLWAFAIGKRLLVECMPALMEGDQPGAMDYGSALVACSVRPPVYFGRAMPPPPEPSNGGRRSGLGMGQRLPLPTPLAHSASSGSLPFDSPALTVTTATPGMSVAMGGMRLEAISPRTPSPAPFHSRKVATAVQQYTSRFNEKPPPALEAAAARFVSELAPRISTIAALDALDQQAVTAGRPRAERPADGRYPTWTAPCCLPVTGEEGKSCGVCKKPGVLTECAGCGLSYHFDCCDPSRQPPGGDVAWYCGRNDCKGSFMRDACGWKQEPVPADKFRCSICLDDVNIGLKCQLDDCQCIDKACVGCMHERIFRMKEGETAIECQTCRKPQSAVMRPLGNGEHVAERFVDMQQGGESDEPVHDVARRRRGSVSLATFTEQNRMLLEAERASRLHALNEQVAAGTLSGEKAVRALWEAGGDVDSEAIAAVTDDGITHDDVANVRAAAEGQIRCAPGGRGKGKAANRHSPPVAIVSTPNTSPTTEPAVGPVGPVAFDAWSPTAKRRALLSTDAVPPSAMTVATDSSPAAISHTAKTSAFSKLPDGQKPRDRPKSTNRTFKNIASDDEDSD